MAKRNRHHKTKKNQILSNIRQSSFPEALRIPPSEPMRELQASAQTLESYLEFLKAILDRPAPEKDQELEHLLRLLSDLAIGIWRTRQKMIQPGTEQPLEEMRHAFRPLESAHDALKQAGMEIKDRINQPYVTGMAEKVIAFEPKSGLTRELIIETIKPAVYYQGRLLQQGEIIVGTTQTES